MEVQGLLACERPCLEEMLKIAPDPSDTSESVAEMKQTYSLKIEFKENEDNETYEIEGSSRSSRSRGSSLWTCAVAPST